MEKHSEWKRLSRQGLLFPQIGRVSVQGSVSHYCSPKKTLLALEDYNSVEIYLDIEGLENKTERITKLRKFLSDDEVINILLDRPVGWFPVRKLQALLNIVNN